MSCQIIPISDAMREPHKFPAVLTGVMVFLTSEHVNFYRHSVTNLYSLLIVLFGGAGALSYLTFGSKINTVVLVNFDTESKMVQSVRFRDGDIYFGSLYKLQHRFNSFIPSLSYCQFHCNSSPQCALSRMGCSPGVEKPAYGSSGTRISLGSRWSWLVP